MLTTLASTFMTATRMDGFAPAGTAAPSHGPRRGIRATAAVALAALKRLAR